MSDAGGSVKLVLFDVDGVLTDGRLFIGGDGEQLKVFNAKDGFATALLRAHGVLSGVLSGKSSPALSRRARDLKFDVVLTGADDKAASLVGALTEMNVSLDEIVYVGDDVNDLPVAELVASFYAPSDAHSLVLARADHVVPVAGGQGVARAVVEHVLSSRGMTVADMYAPLRTAWSAERIVQ